MGLIVCGDSALASIVSSEFIPTEFWPSLQTLRHMCSRSKEMDVRQITGHFLAYAVDITRRLFNMERLFVHYRCYPCNWKNTWTSGLCNLPRRGTCPHGLYFYRTITDCF